MSASVEINAFLKGLKEAGRKIARQAAPRAVGRFADGAVLTLAKFYCPVKEGWLVASGSVSEVQWQGNRFFYLIGFNEAYAAAVHERLDAHHEAPTQAKYLELAFRESAPKFAPFVIGEMRKGLA